MAILCFSHVDDDAFELVFEVGLWLLIVLKSLIVSWIHLLPFLLQLLDFLLTETLQSELLQIQFCGELQEIIQFIIRHCLVIHLKSLEHEDEMIRETLNADTLKGINLLIAFLAEIGIVTIHHLASDELLEGFIDVLLVLNLKGYRKEGFLTLVVMRTSLADQFITQDTSKVFLNESLLLCALRSGLQSIHQHVEEFIDILLLEDIQRVTIPVLH